MISFTQYSNPINEEAVIRLQHKDSNGNVHILTSSHTGHVALNKGTSNLANVMHSAPGHERSGTAEKSEALRKAIKSAHSGGKDSVLSVAKKTTGLNWSHHSPVKEDVDLNEDAYAKSEENKRSADSAKKQGNMFDYHMHMADHHENLAQHHSEKGRSSVADQHSAKSEQHHEKAMALKEEVEQIDEIAVIPIHKIKIGSHVTLHPTVRGGPEEKVKVVGKDHENVHVEYGDMLGGKRVKEVHHSFVKEEVESIDEISSKLAGNYYGAATKKHIDKVGIKPNMYGRIEKDMGAKRKAGVDRAMDRVMGTRKTNEEVELEEAHLQDYRRYTQAAKNAKAKGEHDIAKDAEQKASKSAAHYTRVTGKKPTFNEENDTTEKKEMAETQLHFIKYAAEEILEYIGMGGEIEEWYQNKLSKVQSDVESLHSYIEGESRRTGMKEEASKTAPTADAPKMVRDRKTGKMYDPKKKFKELMDKPEIKAVMNRLAKEEVELNELSKSTLKSYAKKAMDDVDRRDADFDAKMSHPEIHKTAKKISSSKGQNLSKAKADHGAALDKHYPEFDKDTRKIISRGAGMRGASRRLHDIRMKEEVELAEIFADQGSGSTGTSRGNKRITNIVKKALGKSNTQSHRVSVTLSEPDHQSVSQRKEQIQKRARVTADSKEDAVKKVRQHYKKLGYKVHSAEHHSVVKEELSADEQFDLIEELVMNLAAKNNLDPDIIWEKFEDEELLEAAVDAKGHKSSTGGLTQKGRDAYNAKGGNLQAPVTTPPSKLKAGSKAAGRRKSFCARMGGVEGPMKDDKGRPTRKALALRKWNC